MEIARGLAKVNDVEKTIEQLREIGAATGCLVQAFDARYIAGDRHLETAARLAERERSRDEGIVDDPALEWLLYVAATRQLDRAMELGLPQGEHDVVLACLGGDETVAIERAIEAVGLEETEIEPDEGRLTEWFDITDAERAATTASLESLVCERVALLVVER